MLKSYKFFFIVCLCVSLLPRHLKAEDYATGEDNYDITEFLSIFRDFNRSSTDDVTEKSNELKSVSEVSESSNPSNEVFEDFTENYDDFLFVTESTDFIFHNEDSENNTSDLHNEEIVEESTLNYDDVDEREEIERQRLDRLCAAIIDDISTQNYTDADQKIHELGVNHTRMSSIVFKLYAANVNRFKFINKYALETSDPLISFYVMGALWNIILVRNYYDFNEMCAFHTTLTKKVINSPKIDQDTSKYITNILKTLISPKIAELAIKKLNDALENHSNDVIDETLRKVYSVNETLLFSDIIGKFDFRQTGRFYRATEDFTEIRNKIGILLKDHAAKELMSTLLKKSLDKHKLMADQLYLISEKLYDETICQVIDSSYNELRFADLLEAMWKHETAPQKATTLKCIFENLARNLHNNGQAAMMYAYYFDKLRNVKDFDDLNEDKWAALDEHFQKLPEPIRTLYSNEYVCLRNAYSGDYLGVGKRLTKHSHEALGKNFDKTTKWIIIHRENFTCLLQNAEFSHEYLFSGDTRRLKVWREVYTWEKLDHERPTDEMIWRPRLIDNMFSFETYDEDNDRRLLAVHVHEIIAGMWLTEDDKERWTIESC